MSSPQPINLTPARKRALALLWAEDGQWVSVCTFGQPLSFQIHRRVAAWLIAEDLAEGDPDTGPPRWLRLTAGGYDLCEALFVSEKEAE